MSRKYIAPFESVLRDDNGKRITTLLWGDSVHEDTSSGNRTKVRSRGQIGWVPTVDLTDKGLLEIYVIDVGQGDSVLMRTPNDKWHLIDAGVANRSQMTKKGAANFLRWKFLTDLRESGVRLENVIITHPDYDHYGGILDLFRGELFDGRIFDVEVENFYHSGMGRFKSGDKLGHVTQSEVDDFPNGFHGIQKRGTFITELLSGKTSFRSPSREFASTFAEYADLVGSVPSRVRRLTHRDKFVPTYGIGDRDVVIRVLGPILETLANASLGLRRLGSESVTRNGHSIVLRVEYGDARILLTGDLNAKSQRLLLSYQPASEFAVDVAKGCHHGSEDIEYDFVKAMGARTTVVSSGDNENYAHPRPSVLGASARYGREAVDRDGRLLAPLLYSTELARSVKLAYASRVRVELDSSTDTRTYAPEETDIKARESGAAYRPLEYVPLSTDLVYGLINVRTDGKHILCATMEEKGNDFDIKVFEAGVSP